MVQRGTNLQVADNSGAKALRVINIPGNSRVRFAYLGQVITASVRGAASGGAIKDHQVVSAVIVRTHKEARRSDGSYIRFDDNAAVIVDKDKNPLGTRIFGPVARELRESGFTKIISMAEEVW